MARAADRVLAVLALATAASLIAGGCSATSTYEETGADASDAAQLDAGGPDGSEPIDAGSSDAGAIDGGEPDAGTEDAGAPDGGPVDAGAPDAGPGDAGTAVDAGTDAGAPLPCVPAPASGAVVSARDTGAAGDGRTDDTAAIQAAVDQIVGTGGVVEVPDGTYLIDALVGIRLGSWMTLSMSSGAVLQAIPNDQGSYVVLRIEGATNVNVVGGTVKGERDAHLGSTGEWGMGIGIYGATNVVLSGVTLRDAWGDGIYIRDMSTSVAICSVVADNNRRQGLSIVSADGVIVDGSVFMNTNGTDPQAGIDLEPNPGGTDAVRNVRIINSRFLNNAFVGIDLMGWAGPVSNVTVDGNVIEGNGGGVLVYKTDGNSVTNNEIVDAVAYGVSLEGGASGNIVTGNTITVTGGASGNAIVDSSGGNTTSPNTIR